jgi:hypothetical protein
VGNKDGLWTTVFAAAVFINEDAPVDNAKLAAGNKGTLQEEVLRQTLEAQPVIREAPESLPPLQKELTRPGADTAKAPPAKKTLA